MAVDTGEFVLPRVSRFEKDTAAEGRELNGIIRRELAGLLGAPVEPDREDLRATFLDSVSLVRSLQKDRHISEQHADQLLTAFAALYLGVLVNQTVGEMFGTPPTPNLHKIARWLSETR